MNTTTRLMKIANSSLYIIATNVEVVDVYSAASCCPAAAACKLLPASCCPALVVGTVAAAAAALHAASAAALLLPLLLMPLLPCLLFFHQYLLMFTARICWFGRHSNVFWHSWHALPKLTRMKFKLTFFLSLSIPAVRGRLILSLMST